MSINPVNSIPEPLRQQIEDAASKSLDMNIPNNDDPVDEDCAPSRTTAKRKTDSAHAQGRTIEASPTALHPGSSA
jgi:hypothetical protein